MKWLTVTVALLLAAIAALAVYTNVPTTVTQEDATVFEQLGLQSPPGQPTFEQEIALIRQVQGIVFKKAPLREGVVHYLGVSDDVRAQIAEADCVVLPSYREGTPRTLLEAAAMARPIITTDAPGCRGVVDDGQTGFLCQVRDALDLAAKMEQMLTLTPAQRGAMGLRGRQKMENEFDEQIVIRKYLDVLDGFLKKRP
jgi:glycosyltransferase involved in cell wall biosynthesis